MSAAASLRAESHRLDSIATELDRFIDDSHHDWVSLALWGQAADAARTSLRRTTDSLLAQAQQMRAAAGILALYAPLQEQLERLRVDLTAWAGRADATSVGRQASRLLSQLDALADALDWACARQLTALCTPALAEAPSRLEDFSDLPLPQLHQVQLAMAGDNVRELAAANPDMSILETSPGRLVVLVDPEGIGTQAAQVTTFVGGVGSSEPASWPSSLERARSLAKATGGPAVAWIGYSAPPSLPYAAHEEPARRGAAELTRFQRSLGQRFPRAQRIVVGYSYGSVVVGKAAREAPVGEDVVLVGSPGASAAHAHELHGRVWSATNAQDPIAIATGPLGGIHGPNPAAPEFGAMPLPGASGRPGDHGSYWKDPAFLRGLGEVARLH